MYKRISIFLTYILTFVQTKEFKCGLVNSYQQNERIVGGYDIGYYKYPWFAVLLDGDDISCGGSLIASRTVLTAAHCFKPYFQYVINDNSKLNDVYVVKLGAYNRCRVETTQKKFNISKVIVHEDYFEKMPYFDIALILLNGNTDDFTPVCLPSVNWQVKEGTIQGFGRLKHEKENLPCTLREARLLLYSDDVCRQTIKSAENSADSFTHAFCAGYLEGGIDACQGDSGGPFLITGKQGELILQGITSFGYGCAEKHFLGIYSNVSQFTKWIDRTKKLLIPNNHVITTTITSNKNYVQDSKPSKVIVLVPYEMHYIRPWITGFKKRNPWKHIKHYGYWKKPPYRKS